MSNDITIQGGAIQPLSDDDIALMNSVTHEKDFTQEDLLLPYLQIVQSISGYVKRSDPDYIEGAQEGDLIDSVTRKLRKRGIFLPCRFEVHYTEWKAKRGGLVKMWGNDRSGYDAAEGDFGTRKTANGNDIVPTACYYGLFLGEGDDTVLPCLLGLGGTQYRKSRRLNTLIDMLDKAMFARAYTLETVPESNEQGSWMGWKIEPSLMTLQLPGGRGLFERARLLREQIISGKARAMPAPASERDGGGAGGAPSDDEVPF